MIVFVFGVDDVAAEEQDRIVELSLLREEVDVEYASSPSVTIAERVDGLELQVSDRHLDQWVRSIGSIQKAMRLSSLPSMIPSPLGGV